ncbi:MAG: VPLPA-CTERM sorting domain-containing protein [Pseudomonadota bacterium]
MKIKNLVLGAFAAILAFSTVKPVSAALLYDGSAKTTEISIRPAGQAPLARFEFEAPAEINGITTFVDPDGSGTVKFLIFDGESLVFDIATPFSDTGGQQQMVSPFFSFNVLPGREYSIGTVLDVPTQHFFGLGQDTQGVVTNRGQNSNVITFNSPTLGFPGGGSGGVTLEGSVSPTAVPIPAVAPMLLAALGALGFIGRRRRSARMA